MQAISEGSKYEPKHRIVVRLDRRSHGTAESIRTVAESLQHSVGGFIVRTLPNNAIDAYVRRRRYINHALEPLTALNVPIGLHRPYSALARSPHVMPDMRTVRESGFAKTCILPLWSGKTAISEALSLQNETFQMVGALLPETSRQLAYFRALGRRRQDLVREHARLFALLGGNTLLCDASDLFVIKQDEEIDRIARIRKERNEQPLRYVLQGVTDLWKRPHDSSWMTPHAAMNLGADFLLYDIEDLHHPDVPQIELLQRISADISQDR